jgi:predicted MPP superfamily phosphohydrolase
MEFRILWVDDEWEAACADGVGDIAHSELSEWEAEWIAQLARRKVTLLVTRRSSTAIAEDLTREKYDALILDYRLGEDLEHPDGNASKLLERLQQGMRSLPPIALFSRYSPSELRARFTGQIQGSIWAVFQKVPEGAQGLCAFLLNVALKGPLNFIVISDLHMGFLTETGGISPDDFLHSLATDIEAVTGTTRIDGLIVPGDLAWRSQSADLNSAFLAVRKLRFAARLDRPEQFVFCPGNHDLDFTDLARPWAPFSKFVDLLGSGPDGHFRSRFVVAWNDSLQTRAEFHAQESLLSLTYNMQRGVVFAGLNSCSATGKGHEVLPEIVEAQWTALQRALDRVPARTFRIAVLHHPIFSTPGGVYKDDPSLEGQGMAMQLFSKLGFGLVLHGHTHFAGIHAHRIRVLNGANSNGRISKIVTIACPSVIAQPSSTSPQRQYFVLKLSSFEQSSRTRSLSLVTRVFDPKDRSWSCGDQVAPGEFDVESAE